MSPADATPVEYRTAHVRDRLAADPRVAALDLTVRVVDDKVYVAGTVQTPGQRDVAGAVVAEALPDLAVHNELVVGDCPEPPEAATEHLA